MGILDWFKKEKKRDHRKEWAYWMKKELESQGVKVSNLQIALASRFIKLYECPGCGEKLGYIGKSDQPPLCKKCGRLTVPAAPPDAKNPTVKERFKSGKDKAQLSKQADKINMAIEAHDKANLLCDEGKNEEALQWFDKAIEIYPDEAEFWYNKGVTLLKLKRAGQALACCQKAINLNSGIAEFWLNHGASLALLNRFEEAITSYDRGLEINPTHATLVGNKFVALAQLGRGDEANKYFIDALKKGGEPLVKEVTEVMRKNMGVDMKIDFKSDTASVRFIPRNSNDKGINRKN